MGFCDGYEACDRKKPGSIERKLINMITRFSGLKTFTIETTPEHEAMCWWLDDLNSKK